MSSIPDNVKEAIVDACTKFGTTTLGFSYGFFGLIIAIVLIVLACYKVISWLACIVSIIVLAVLILLFIMFYQYTLEKSISNGLDSINLADLLNGFLGKIPTNIPGKIPIPKPPTRPPNINVKAEKIKELEDSVEE